MSVKQTVERFGKKLSVWSVLFLACVLPGLSAGGSSQLFWDKEQRQVSASVEGLPMGKLLAKMAQVSGWEIFVEPGMERSVSARFNQTPMGEALKLLLGDLNYALVPHGKGGFRLYVYSQSLHAATEAVVAEKVRPPNWLANEILLTVDPEKELDVEALAKELGGKVVGRAEELSSYRLQFDSAEAAEAARNKLALRDDVETSDNFAYPKPDPLSAARAAANPSTFGLDSKPVGDGSLIKVAIIDTPVQRLDGKMNDFLLESVHIAGVPNVDSGSPTHGTSMTHTLLHSMALVTKDQESVPVKILPIDVYGNNPSTTTFEVSRGLYAAIQQDPQVINLSLGGAGESPMMEALLDLARRKQILVFASAGNSPTTDPTYPAASPSTIAVTAADWRGNIAPYANRGEFVDVKAPGTAVVRYNGQSFVSSGTSTASAFVTGQAAAYRAQGFSQDQTRQMILQRFDVNTPVKK